MLSPSTPTGPGEDDRPGCDTGSVVGEEPPATETDRFGFILENGSAAGTEGPPPELVRQREAKWINLIGQWDRVLRKKTSKVKEQCQKGIPASLRAKCWPLLCGASGQMNRNKDLYQSLDSKPALQSWVDVIERDLDRQFPFHEMFVSRDGHGQRGLFRVLKAYTQYLPEDGYCQAQGPVAAVLLMNMPAEEAFWCLVQISEQYLPGYYSPLLEGVLFDAAMLTWVLKRACPAAHRHLQKHGVEPLMFATDWLMCLYTRHLPFNTLLRVWDLFFCYGVRVLFQVAVVLVRLALGRGEQRHECQGQMETLERLRAIREQVKQEDDSFITEVLSVPLSGQDLERQTERELERWRKDRPSSTFDPRGRCRGYRTAWQRIQEEEAAHDQKEREKGNLTVPLIRSASTLSLSPSLLRKRWNKGRKASESGREEKSDGGNLRRESWMDSTPAMVLGVPEEEEERASVEHKEPRENREPQPGEPSNEKRTQIEHRIQAPDDRRAVGGAPVRDHGPPSDPATSPPHHTQELASPGQSQATIPGDNGNNREQEMDSETVTVETKEGRNQLKEIKNVRSTEHVTAEMETETEGGTEAEIETEAKIETEAEREAEIEAKIEREAETGKDTVTDTHTGTGPQMESETDNETGAETHTEAETRTHTEEKTDVRTESPTLTEVHTETRINTDIETDTVMESNTGKEKEKASETRSDAKEPHAETKTDRQADVQGEEEKPRDAADRQTETEEQRETGGHAETPESPTENEGEPEPDRHPDLQMKACVGPETHTETETDTQREPETWSQPETHTDMESQAKLETQAEETREESELDSVVRGDAERRADTERRAELAEHTETGLQTQTDVQTPTETEEAAMESPADVCRTTTQDDGSPQSPNRTTAAEPDGKSSSLHPTAQDHAASKEADSQVISHSEEERDIQNVRETEGDREDVFEPHIQSVPSHIPSSVQMESLRGISPPKHGNPLPQSQDLPPPVDSKAGSGNLVTAHAGAPSQKLSNRSPPLPGAARSGPPSGEFRLRKSSSSQFRPARRLSEDLFTVPHLHTPDKSKSNPTDPDQSQPSITEPNPTVLRHSNQVHPTSIQDPTHPNSPHRVPESSPAFVPSQGGPKPAQGPVSTPRRFGLFRRLRGEQGGPKVPIPKILIQDFSEGPVERMPGEGEEKLSSRERRRRRREQERREKEEEKLLKKKDKEVEKEKERERRKPQTRGKSFQVQGRKSSTNDPPLGKRGSQILDSQRHSAAHAEAYF